MSGSFEQAWVQGALRGQTANFHEAVRELDISNRMLAQAYAEISQLKQSLLNTQMEVAVAKAEVSGRLAQFYALKAQHPESPLLALTNERNANGNQKTKVRQIFDKAFDATLTEIGRSNPRLAIIDPAVYRH